MAKKQGEMRKQLLGDSELIQQENDADQKVVEAFEAKKRLEQERRLKNIDAQKRLLHKEYEQQIKDKYGDHDEMLRKKAELQKQKEEEEASILKQLEERKQKLKQTSKVEGMTDAEKAKMLNQLETAYEAIDAAYLLEMNRQQLMMRKRLDARKQKVRQMEAIRKKEQDKKKEDQAASV